MTIKYIILANFHLAYYLYCQYISRICYNLSTRYILQNCFYAYNYCYSCLGDQFSRLRQGDRYFYDLANSPGSFSSSELEKVQNIVCVYLIMFYIYFIITYYDFQKQFILCFHFIFNTQQSNL